MAASKPIPNGTAYLCVRRTNQKECTAMFKLQLFLIVLIFILSVVAIFRTDKQSEQCTASGGVLVESSTGNYVCVDKK
jgi:integral membrane sensor domain MASE1